MSEKFPANGQEKDTGKELLTDSHEKAGHNSENVRKQESKSTHEHKKNIEKIRSSIEEETKYEKIKHKEVPDESDRNNQESYVSRDLISESYRRTLNRTRRQLSPAMRSFSKFVHSPVVDRVSEVGGKTIARPSGVLSGGIFAFLGSGLLLWTARHYGYEYNFLLFAILFVLGFFVGLLVEVLFKLVIIKLRK